jgi:hypothetical protein
MVMASWWRSLKDRFTLNEASAKQPGNLPLLRLAFVKCGLSQKLAETASRKLEQWCKHS